MDAVINNQIPKDLDEGNRKREAELLQKPKIKKANEEVNSRKKPGRKRLEVTESNTKKEKNRVAQRAWRERKEKYVLELEAKIAELESAKNKSESEKQQLKMIIEKLRSENTYLKNATSFIFTPTKETEMFMEQNKLKILQQKNMKQSNPELLNSTISLSAQTPVNPELINEPVQTVPSNGINENMLSESNPEILDEIYKLMNIQNPELMAYQNNTIPSKDSTLPITNISAQESINSNLITSNSVMNSNSAPLCSEIISSGSNNEVLASLNNSTNNSLYNVVGPMQKENIVIPSNYEVNTVVPTTSTTDPNLILLMNEQNNPNQVLLNQQPINTINQNIIGSTNPEVMQNPLTTPLTNQPIDQNSLLAMTMLNNVPSTSFENIQPSTIAAPTTIQNIDNNLYALNGLELNNNINHNLSKPIISGSMNYRTEAVKEKSQPITDELFNNMIQMLHKQQQPNIDGGDEDDMFINQLNQNARVLYTNTVTGIPSPTSTIVYGKEKTSTQENNSMHLPYTPEDLDSDSNRSGEGVEIKQRTIEDSDSSSNLREIKNEDKRSNSTHSTLQFPAEQKPTKLNIPYSVFPRVTQETVDGFINDNKLSEEEIECLCSELKNKATCKEKLRYISQNIELKGWNIDAWERGKLKFIEEAKKKEKENEQIKQENIE
jgi:hypothetical protein